ncbi:MAG: type I-E CRISPR-associated protein Cas6/Cse3/CasE [Methylococcaceae bacterium]
MIASVLHLSRADVKALKITDAYSLHRVVYDLFDDVRTESEKEQSISSGILYADKGGDFHGRRILMLSNRQPNAPIHGEVSIRKIADSFLDYSQYRFEVVVNPTQRDSASRKIIPLRKREEIARWFIEKAPQWGFEVSSAHLEVEDIVVKKFTEKTGREVTQGQARILGRLTVTDKENFVQSFQNGIGRGRSFGCGLLQVVPI